ncbi:Unknown protein sequence [Pseudomonas syringae pv. daphniphylli]|uniref:Uncharacterized protein n=1 Tax=Pseudomonas syringae pv. daphniphylli TaxID=264455 RepID=A0A9X0KTV2_PSESX|nr:Unknown protein sequence [Pseudomonas syringae pv. daphniphylli]
MDSGLRWRQNDLRFFIALDLATQLQLEIRIGLGHPFGQQRGQPRIVFGARHYHQHFTVERYGIRCDIVQLTTQCTHIADLEFNFRAFCRRIDELGNPSGFGRLQISFGFLQLGLARMSDSAVDATGQCRCLGHQRARTSECVGRRIHITLLQADLAATQIGFGQTTLKRLEANIGRIGGLQRGQLILGRRQLIADDVLLKLSERVRLNVGGRRLGSGRTLAGTQQDGKCDKQQIAWGERLHSCDSLVCAKNEQVYTARLGRTKLSKNNAAADTTIDGPAGVSLNHDNDSPTHTAITPNRLAPSAICSGERA